MLQCVLQPPTQFWWNKYSKQSDKADWDCYGSLLLQITHWGPGKIGAILQMTFIFKLVFTPGQFAPSGIVVVYFCVSLCVCQSPACPHDNLSRVQARITKFGPKWKTPWLRVLLFGRLPLTFMVKFNLKVKVTFQVRISTAGPKMHLSTV